MTGHSGSRVWSAPVSMFVLLTLLSISFSLVSYSAARAEQGTVAKACIADVKAKCAGQDSVKDCLKEHLGELLTNCKNALLKVVAIAKACRTDIKQHCADVKRGGGRIQACMESHLADVSDPCKEALGKAAAGNK
jgi:Cysteine rich repeat